MRRLVGYLRVVREDVCTRNAFGDNRGGRPFAIAVSSTCFAARDKIKSCKAIQFEQYHTISNRGKMFEEASWPTRSGEHSHLLFSLPLKVRAYCKPSLFFRRHRKFFEVMRFDACNLGCVEEYRSFPGRSLFECMS